MGSGVHGLGVKDIDGEGKYGLISGCLIWMGDEWYGYGVGLSMESNIDGGGDIANFFEMS